MSKTARVARRNRPQSRPEPIGAALHDLARQLGITKKLSQYSVLASWDQIVGDRIAKVTQADRIENGILFVKTATAPWRTELTMRRLEIIDKINGAVGKKIVKDIRFR
ncbi:MAG: DUF721 domain-containing protein [Ignavibacteriae bacterium]|nr:DUF721 domain-containing protein [Ignavibacteriota bacterium]